MCNIILRQNIIKGAGQTIPPLSNNSNNSPNPITMTEISQWSVVTVVNSWFHGNMGQLPDIDTVIRWMSNRI